MRFPARLSCLLAAWVNSRDGVPPLRKRYGNEELPCEE